MTFLALPSAPATRVTLLDADGLPTARWTLQAVSREGRTMRWTPEGVLRQLGSGAASIRRWAHRGFRQELGLRWSYGLLSIREAWTGGTWATAEELPTAQAHSEILDWGARSDLQVEPFVGSGVPIFLARAFEQGVSLQDTKGVVHPSLELDLRRTSLVASIVLEQNSGWGIGPWGLLAWGD